MCLVLHQQTLHARVTHAKATADQALCFAAAGPSGRQGAGSKGTKRARTPVVVDDSGASELSSEEDEEAAAAKARKGKQKVAR